MKPFPSKFAEEPKKFKVIVEKANMDPFEKLLDVDHLIYQHFTGHEVLKMSKVSKAWYMDIGKSSVCMNKIRFNFFLKEDQQIAHPTELYNTKRHYANVAISWEHPGMTLGNRTAVIDKLASSVIDLEVRLMCNIYWKPVYFPKLKKLRIIHSIMRCNNWEDYGVSPSFMDVVGQSDVEHLKVYGSLPPESTFDFITKRLNTLKKLSLAYSNIMADDRISILHQLKLTELTTATFNYNEGFNLFLKSQADTLKHFAVSRPSEEVLAIALELPKLQIFEIDKYWASDSTELSKLPISKSIIDVQITRFYKFAPKYDLQKLLERVPNMNKLTLDELNINRLYSDQIRDDILIISKTAMKLENLCYGCAPSDIKEKYEAIKQNVDIIANHRIQIKPADQNGYLHSIR